jgi:hypothetical protein
VCCRRRNSSTSRLDTLAGRAVTRGVFASIVADGDPDDLQSAIDITLCRLAEHQNLQVELDSRQAGSGARSVIPYPQDAQRRSAEASEVKF